MAPKYFLPQYDGDLGVFVASLRAQVFDTQEKAAQFFRLDRTTINRYENGKSRPAIGYIAVLSMRLIERYELTESELIEVQQKLLQRLNSAIRHHYQRDVPFRNWEDLQAVAWEYITKRRKQGQDRLLHSASTPVQYVINITFFVEALQAWNEGFFRWSKTSSYVEASWAGKVIYAMSAITNRITPGGLLAFCLTILLWIATVQLMTPALHWPLDDPEVRKITWLKYGLALWFIPLLVATITPPDRSGLFSLETPKQHLTFWTLKFVGALVGFWVFAMSIVGMALAGYYLSLSWLIDRVDFLFALVPLFFSYVTARRIPVDRREMFGDKLRFHEADHFFLKAFLGIGPVSAFCLYLLSGFLSDRRIGPILLLLPLTIIALWEYRQQNRKALSDLVLILILGLALPVCLLLLAVFLTPDLPSISLKELPFFIITAIYFLSWTLLLATLLIRKQFTLTLSGVLMAFLVIVVAYLIAVNDRWWGVGFALIVMLIWGLWGYRRFRLYLWVHRSFWIMIAVTGGGVYLLQSNLLPPWVNGLGLLLTAIILNIWAYQISDDSH